MAGVDRDARSTVEASVRQALGARAASEPWTVSLVRVAGRWSVTMNGPGERYRQLSLVADEGHLAQAIRGALADAAGEIAGPPDAVVVPESGGPQRAVVQERHDCHHCRRPMTVAHESHAGEPRQAVPVACPHCWVIGHVEIGVWAAVGGDYRCEKA